MQRKEYLSFLVPTASGSGGANMTRELNVRAKEGWCFVGMASIGNFYRVVMDRDFEAEDEPK